MIITIDGYAGTGKTTTSQRVADLLNIPYYDTGAMYRAATLFLTRKGISSRDHGGIRDALKNFDFSMQRDGGTCRYFLNGEEVTHAIRSPEIDAAVSEISAVPEVRETLWQLQRGLARQGQALFEGRDMGTVVFPQAEVKIFLTASPEIRANRRLQELHQKRPEERLSIDRERVQDNLLYRDRYDSKRALAPLACAKDALVIDTGHLTLEEVVERILRYRTKRLRAMNVSWRFSKTMRPFYRFILFIAWSIYKIFYRQRTYGLEHFFSGPAIIAANHASYLDPPLVAISSPEEIHFLAKIELFKSPVFGRLIRALNSHPVRGDVADAQVFKKIMEIVHHGNKLLLFPEGARSADGSIASLKPGIGLLVAKTGAAVIPAYLVGTYDVWSIKKRFPKFCGKTACIFGSPILWSGFSHLERRDAYQALAEELKNSLERLKKWYEEGAIGTPP